MKKFGYQGMSLLEAVVVLGIVAILAAAVVPMWQEVVGRHRVALAIDQFTASLVHARSEALRRGLWVTLERRDNCAQNNWSCGWISYVDENVNSLWDKGEPVIQEFETVNNVNAYANVSTLARRIRLTPTGTSNGVLAGSLFFEHGTDKKSCKRLVLSSGARWRVEACQ